MEKHFLSEFLTGIERETPRPWYNGPGDCIVYQMADEATVAERVDDVLTIYHSALTDKPIGFQIKGVRAIIKHFGWEGLVVDSADNGDELQSLSISAILLAAYESGVKTIGRRRAYAGLLDSTFTKSARMQQSDLNEHAGVCGE